jgi:hypothetical protein
MQVISYDWDESFHWDFDFRIPDIYLQIILLDRLIYVVGLPPPFLQSTGPLSGYGRARIAGGGEMPGLTCTSSNRWREKIIARLIAKETTSRVDSPCGPAEIRPTWGRAQMTYPERIS